MTDRYHEPVMVREVCQLLQPRCGDRIADCNLGTGGHSLALLAACGGQGRLLGLDLDKRMIETARQRFLALGIPQAAYTFVHANHGDLPRVLAEVGWEHADRILMDLGASSLHFDDPERGFSLQGDGPLDMRYDGTGEGPTAADLVNGWDESELARLFREQGDERWALRIARHLARRRTVRPFARTGDLAAEVGAAIPRKAWPPRIHPATRVFLALRVAVNAEEEALARGLDAALDALAPGGRLAVLTFQSHEDRTVKRRFRQVCEDEVDPTWGRVRTPALFRDLTRKPLLPSPGETEQNPRSRSTKLRGVEKVDRGGTVPGPPFQEGEKP